MERLISIFIGMGILYAVYALGLKNLDYTSEAKRLKIKEQIKKEGLSTSFYFISPKRLLLFEFLSGGLFVFYWAYKQWQAIAKGYKNIAGKKLKYSPFVRSVCMVFSIYSLTAIVNRTCVYMRKAPAFPPALWGTVLWAGAVLACVPQLAGGWRVLAALSSLLPAYVLQNHINSLPKELPPSRIKIMEIGWLVFSWLIWGCVIFLFQKYMPGK